MTNFLCTKKRVKYE